MKGKKTVFTIIAITIVAVILITVWIKYTFKQVIEREEAKKQHTTMIDLPQYNRLSDGTFIQY